MFNELQVRYGFSLPFIRHSIFCSYGMPRAGTESIKGFGMMVLMYWIGGGVVLALFVYLVIALLKPEMFP